MELKDFVKETLLQITQGIKEAQEATEEYGSVINPSSYNSGENYNHATIKNVSVTNIKFTIPAVFPTVDSENKPVYPTVLKNPRQNRM